MISVVMSVYNGKRYLKEQINSILYQTRSVDEILIIDDKSDDDSVNIINTFASVSNIPIKLICHEKNIGVVKTFEEGFIKAQQGIVFFCDQDDIWHKDKVKIVMEVLEKNSTLMMVFSNADLIDEIGNSISSMLWKCIYFYEPWMRRGKIHMYQKGELVSRLLKSNVVTGMTIALRKNAQSESLVIPFSNNMMFDSWVAIICAMNFNLCAMNLSLVKYRQHTSNVIGVQHETRIKDILSNNMKNAADILIKYKDIRRAIGSRNGNVSLEIIQELDDCIEFFTHRNINLAGKKGKLKKCTVIVWDKVTGRYRKYFANSSFVLIKDILCVLIQRSNREINHV